MDWIELEKIFAIIAKKPANDDKRWCEDLSTEELWKEKENNPNLNWDWDSKFGGNWAEEAHLKITLKEETRTVIFKKESTFYDNEGWWMSGVSWEYATQ